jgi:hypothetical protein
MGLTFACPLFASASSTAHQQGRREEDAETNPFGEIFTLPPQVYDSIS